jgi:SAM-dependent methyltransferase
MVRLASDGGFAGAVLDAGCGTGENALYLASLGLSVLGVDVAETALAIARAKAGARGIEVEFAAADAFRLDVRLLLRGIFRAAGGTHDDWDAYDRVMADERRTAVLITPRRVYTNPSAS